MSKSDRIDAILADCCERQNQGEPVDLPQILADHPDLAPELVKAFLALGVADAAFGRTAAPEPRPPERIGRYGIRRELGTGGMGTVYLAEADGEDGRSRFSIPTS